MINSKIKIIWTIIGNILLIISFIFIIYRIVQYKIDFSLLASPFVILGLFFSAFIFGSSIFLTSFNFHWLLSVLSNVRIEKKLTVNIYCTSNLYKYLPGNVFQFVGRNRLALENDKLSHTNVAIASLLDNIFLCIAALIITVLCVFNFFTVYITQIKIPVFFFIITSALFISCIIFLLVFRKRIKIRTTNVIHSLKNLKIISLSQLLLICILRLLVVTFTFIITLFLLGQFFDLELILKTTGLFVLSWVAGFLTPGAPAGLGIREAILIMFLGNSLNINILLPAAVIHRVVCIVGDIFAFVFGIGYFKYNKTV